MPVSRRDRNCQSILSLFFVGREGQLPLVVLLLPPPSLNASLSLDSFPPKGQKRAYRVNQIKREEEEKKKFEDMAALYVSVGYEYIDPCSCFQREREMGI